MSQADLPKAETPASPGRARIILLGLLGLAGASGAWWLWDYETRGKFWQETNDAELEADTTAVSPRIAGYVAQVLVADNQDVKAGDPLVRIDPRDYRAKSAQAAAQVALAKAARANAQAAMSEQDAAIEQAAEQLRAAQTKASYDAAQVRRYAPLVATGAEQGQQLAQLQAQADQSAAQLRAQQAALAGQRRRLAALSAQLAQAQAQGEGSQAQLDAATNDLGDTVLRASIAGRIGDKTATPGQFAPAGTRLMSIVPLDQIYVVANFKETQLAGMRIGQSAKVTVDALGGVAITGQIISLAPGTGSHFSLLRPSNATGNFTKIVQRVPVRIAIKPTPAQRQLLVPGLSVSVAVDTSGAQGSR